jgi:hypothetical protein
MLIIEYALRAGVTLQTFFNDFMLFFHYYKMRLKSIFGSIVVKNLIALLVLCKNT